MNPLVVLLALLLAACGGSSPTPPQPQPTSVWTIGPIINGTNYSPGVTWSGGIDEHPGSD